METFRFERRGHSGAADLDRPPRATLGSVINVYDPADGARYLAGEHVPAERVYWDRREGPDAGCYGHGQSGRRRFRSYQKARTWVSPTL